PVSSVQLVPECLSQGQMKVSCRSEADILQYNWTLDGHILTDSEVFSRNTESNIIVLRQNISGRLVCSVSNRVSHSLNETSITGCVFSSLLTFRLRAVAVVLLLTGLFLYLTWKLKKYEKATPSALSATVENPENSVMMIQLNLE
ncbi:hypothetical protein ATANTOWER_027231, partial [Ataeniobius toweri]|nr:hypothetical protein [Ataeniobius toweri]